MVETCGRETPFGDAAVSEVIKSQLSAILPETSSEMHLVYGMLSRM
jgi:hypothetical protein